MPEEIKVYVIQRPGRVYLQMRYIDPISGKQVARSTKTDDEEKATRAAAVWEDELNTGRYAAPSRITWAEFRQRYEGEKLAGLAEGTRGTVKVTFDYIEEIVNPDRLAKLTAEVISGFQSKLRKKGIKETTVALHMRNVKAALRWAANMGMMHKAPKIDMPKIPKGQTLMKGRPITGEEFDRMVKAAAEVRPHDTAVWVRLLNGLWLSGLRIDEACILSWDEEAPFSVDLSGRRPVFRIFARAQKARRDELLPMTPDFAQWLLEGTPEAERVGKVFKIATVRGKKPFDSRRVGRVISDIGKKAVVVVNKADGKFASAHDLRRAFGTRWSKRVMPAVLQRLMRHGDIGTTMKYYVSANAADVADDLWAQFGPEKADSSQGDISGDTRANQPITAKPATASKSLYSKENADGGT